MNDWELIQNYCRTGSESAFETLVKRHVDYVYCAALRQVRDPSLAEDVSQTVFMLLAQKAKSFQPSTVLISWLFRTTHFVAARALRTESRRQQRELEAAQMNPTTTTPDTDHQWERVSPVLDEALAALPGKDRDAVLLRFIGRKPFSQVGAEIGVTEDAAKKRVSRALAQLREFFLRRGTTLSVATLAIVLSERVVQASPAALTTKITAAVGSSAVAASTPAAALLKTTLRDLFWRKVKWGAAISAGVVTALLVTTSVLRPAHSQAMNSTAATPPAQTQTSIDSQPVAAADPTANQEATNHVLVLSVLRSEDQQPLSGARVLVERALRKRERAFDSTTDASGKLIIPIPTQAFRSLVVWVSAEGRMPMIMIWQAYEFNDPVISHTILLEPGEAASGTVVDESGNPIPGAKVTFEGPGMDSGNRDNAAFHPELSGKVTDANGRWATTQLPLKGGVGMRVDSPDYAPGSASVYGLPGFPTNAILVLSRGVTLSGRITTPDGTPVSNANVSRQNGTYFSSKTDADGLFHWPHIEPGQVFVDVEADGFETIHESAWATNAANECAFTMTPSSNSVPPTAAANVPQVRLNGTVVDADTGKPIPSFKVLLGMASYVGSPADSAPTLFGAHLIGEGRDGRFDWQLPRDGGFRLQVEAEGYLASASEVRNDSDADRGFDFRLQHATILAGRVVTPEGSAAENAIVTFTGPNMGAMMQQPGQLFVDPNHGYETARTRTDRKGNFQLKLKTGARGVAVIHESGSALVTLDTATNAPIVLQPWGAVDGTLYLSGQPATNQTLSLGGSQQLDFNPQVSFGFGYMASTDEHGHFHFDKVLPGEATITRVVAFTGGGESVTVNFDLTTKVKVESDAVTTVELRRHGRPVIGRIVFQGSPDDVRWASSQASLQGKEKFPFALSKDGTIRADDVPPGTYTLSIDLQSPSATPIMSSKTFGSLQKEIVVPSAEDESAPVNLGDLRIMQPK